MDTPIATPDQASSAEQARWFVTEVHAHDASLKRYLRRSFPSVRDVDDVVQESYVRVWKRHMAQPITQVSGAVKASVKSFLFQVARRLAIDTSRHNNISPINAVTDLSRLSVTDSKPSADETACTNQEFALLLEAIDSLPARCQQVVMLRRVEALSPSETAERLGISVETVHVQSRRGLQRVQEFLRKRGVIRE